MKNLKITLNYHKFSIFDRGQSLVEILIAIGLASILLPAILTGLVASREGKPQASQRLAATAYLREAEEAVRSVRENWSSLPANGTYVPTISGSNAWTLTTCAGSCTPINGYTRQIVISDVQRNASGNIVTSGGTVDPSTKKVVSSVSWTTPLPSSVSSTAYITRYIGNNKFLHTTQADFSGGTTSNTTVTNGGPALTGAVELTQIPASTVDYGNKFRTDSTSSIGNMTSTGHKTSMRFTAQDTKTVTAIRVYLQAENGTSPQYRYGIQTNNPSSTPPNTPTGTWVGNFGTLTTTSAGWKTINLGNPASLTAGTVYHIVVEPVGTPSGSNNIALLRSSPLNNLIPKTNIADPNANTLFKAGSSSSWVVQGYQSIYELDFNDSTFEGNPYDATTETSIFGNNWYGEKFTVTGTNKTPQSVSFWLRKNNSPPNALTVEIRDNANNSLYTGTIPAASVPSASFGYVTHTFTSSVTLTAGNTYRLVLRTTAGNNNNSYRIYNIATTGADNSTTYDGTNSVFTSCSTCGSANNWADANNQDIGGFYFTVPAPASYPALGTFVSHTSGSFDAGQSAAFNNITWTGNFPAGTGIGIQVAISNSPSGPWADFDYFGPDGSAISFFSSPQAIMPLNKTTGRYLRYKAFLTSSGTSTPSLYDISINYSP